MGFWDNLNVGKPQNNNNGFNIQEFIKFYNENKNNDMNVVLQNMIDSGKVTQEQVNQATSQAQGVYQMLQGLGMIK